VYRGRGLQYTIALFDSFLSKPWMKMGLLLQKKVGEKTSHLLASFAG